MLTLALTLHSNPNKRTLNVIQFMQPTHVLRNTDDIICKGRPRRFEEVNYGDTRQNDMRRLVCAAWFCVEFDAFGSLYARSWLGLLVFVTKNGCETIAYDPFLFDAQGGLRFSGSHVKAANTRASEELRPQTTDDEGELSENDPPWR